jgi:hypothetical protein
MQHQGPTEFPGDGCKVSCNPPSQSMLQICPQHSWS